MKNISKLSLLVFFILLNANINAQEDKYLKLQEKLTILSNSSIPQLNEDVSISVTNVSIQEFLRGVANSSGVNINVDPGLKIDVANNFSSVKVIDILLFIAKQYELDIAIIGNIININKNKIEAPAPPPPAKKVLVNFDNASGLLSIQCDNDDLMSLTKELIDKSGRNVVPAPGLDRSKVSGYIQNMPFENALDKFAFANNLKVRKTEDQVYLIEKNDPVTSPVVLTPSKKGTNKSQQGKTTGQNKNDESDDLEIKNMVGDSLFIDVQSAPTADIIKEAASQLKTDVFFSTPVQGESSISLKRVTFPDLLQFLFRNSNYTYQKVNGIYLIGDNKSLGMKEFKVIQLQNRTVEKIMDFLPADIKGDADIKEFPELNSLLISGLPEKIKSIEMFIRSIDKIVPVVLIEIMIVDLKRTNGLSTGLSAGLGDKPGVTKGAIYPGVDMSFSAQSVNNLINSFNGFGSVKLGKVTPNFYLSLKALETNNIIDLRSTPKLSALNGHEASLTIGSTKYYREQQSNVYGSLTAQTNTIENFKSNDANLTVKIRPAVSGNDQITLEIEVKQEDFTDQIKEFAPFNKIKREFKSLIRVRNQEMVLLGGLEEKSDREDGSGVPFLARIPIIKWFFSNKTKTKVKSKLNIFIKPTIIE